MAPLVQLRTETTIITNNDQEEPESSSRPGPPTASPKSRALLSCTTSRDLTGELGADDLPRPGDAGAAAGAEEILAGEAERLGHQALDGVDVRRARPPPPR
jgi:hypothetical protein